MRPVIEISKSVIDQHIDVTLPVYGPYEIGDIVTLEIKEPADQAGTEQTFYVIGDDAEKVKLLAKDCINTTTLLQSTGANGVYFWDASTPGYWGTGTDPYDIIETETILDETTGKLTLPATHMAAKPAYDYGVKVGGEGRLLRYSEALALYTNENEDILCETDFYWLGSAKDHWEVYIVDSVMQPLPFDKILSDGGSYKVRPVVVISKSEI